MIPEKVKKLAEKESYRKFLGLEVIEIKKGYAKVALKITEDMTNIYNFTHGGIIFSLADEAFELACNSRGYVEYGLNVNISYNKSSNPGEILYAEAKFISESKKIATYHILIFNENKEIIASCQALSYKKTN